MTNVSPSLPCQVVDLSVRDDLPCKAVESGGVQCERAHQHGSSDHWVSEHTIAHYLAGNGYSCSAIGTS